MFATLVLLLPVSAIYLKYQFSCYYFRKYDISHSFKFFPIQVFVKLTSVKQKRVGGAGKFSKLIRILNDL